MHNIRKYLLLLTFLLVTVQMFAGGKVKYSQKTVSINGCVVTFYVTRTDTTYFLAVSFSSEKLMITENPTLLFKTTNDTVLEYNGTLVNNVSQTGLIPAGYIVVPYTSLVSTAMFPVPSADFQLIKTGIKKIRLSTVPIQTEKTFGQDVLGHKLYKFYNKLPKTHTEF